MQKTCTELTERLLKSLDKEYNVIDMGAVVDVITALEETSITKEVLESTRLGKYINELRRKTTNDALAKRAKDLVRKWRERHLSSSHNTHVTPVEAIQSQHSTSVNGTKPQSPLARVVKPPPSPAGRVIKPQSPLLRDPVKVLSPALSVNSEQNSLSPGLVPLKQTTALATYRLNSTASPKLTNSNQNYSVEAVPRTHSSNKRLRKDNVTTPQPLSPLLNDIARGDELPISKKQRLNGETVGNINSQVPSLSPSSRDQNSLDLSVASSTNPELDVGPKKRGRKKGSKSVKNQQIPEDRVKEKLASISRNPKLKTTQELLADLQARGSNVGGASTTTSTTTPTTALARRTEPPTTEEILRSSDVNQTKSAATSRRDDDVTEADSLSPKISTVEEILAQLPPLDVDSIRWSDDDDDDGANGNEENRVDIREITKADVDRLHSECIEGLNGNFQMKFVRTSDEKMAENVSQDGGESVKEIMQVYKRRVNDGTDREFREWHEILARPSCDGQVLHILPYVIID